MDLLKTILIYLTMVFVSSVQTSPDPSLMPIQTATPVPTIGIIATATLPATATPAPTATPTAVPTPNITPNTTYKTMKVGDKGDNVTTMQRRLAELGYYTGSVDGVFGNQTRRSVERFQYYQGLSVDGIAGKRTLTVLYESTEVIFAPVDVTPSPSATSTVKPTTAITSAPPTATPAPTFVPTPTASPAQATVAADTATTLPVETQSQPAESATPVTTAQATPIPSPVPLLEKTFVLVGQTEPMQVQQDESTDTQEPILLHPVQLGDTVYVPYIEILKSAGVVTIPGVDPAKQEIAFSLLSDIYQINYVLDNEGNVTDLTVLKNQTPQVLSLRSALVLDGLFYLPITVTTELTGITYTLDEALTVYTVAIPTSEGA